MSAFVAIASFLVLIFGIAAAVCLLSDYLTSRQADSETQREELLHQQAKRAYRMWGTALLVIALIALPLHALNLLHLPYVWRLFYMGLAAAYILGYFMSRW